MKLHSLLKRLLGEIEKNLNTEQTIDELAESLFISSAHLQRLFKSAFNMTPASYIRSRKLAASLETLSNSKLSIIDIAVESGFDHAQSFIRAFKQEFGITPGEWRKTGQILKVKPPLQLLPSNMLADGVFFGPEIVYVPGFNLVGRSHKIFLSDTFDVPASRGRDFWLHDSANIPNIKESGVYIGLTNYFGQENGKCYTIYTPSVCVNDLTQIPQGFSGNVFQPSLCAKFHYVGEHHYLELDRVTANAMYKAIWSYWNDAKYRMYRDYLFFERIDVSDYDGVFCKMEWYAPVCEKND